MGGALLGRDYRLRQQLVPPHVALPHAGLSALGTAPRRAPSDQRRAAHRQCAPAVRAPPGNEWRPLAERGRCLLLCPAPTSRRVRCLGGRAQGRVEHALLDAHPARLLAVRTTTEPPSLSPGPRPARAGPDGQTDAGDATARDAP